MKLCLAAAIVSLSLAAVGQTVSPVGSTAFALVKEGDKVVPPQARDKITQIFSEKTSGNLVPEIWHIDYFDPTVVMKTTEVTFVAGKLTEITKPKRLYEVFTGSKQMTWKKMRIDSDRAMSIALQQPMLKKIQVRAVQLWLERLPAGSTWKVRLWAARRGKMDQDIQIGDLLISAKTGEIFKNDLRPEKAD